MHHYIPVFALDGFGNQQVDKTYQLTPDAFEVGRCKLDPSLKATFFQPLNPEIAYSAFNLNLVF